MEERVRKLLNDALSSLSELPSPGVIDRLARDLAPLHDQAKASGCMQAFKATCQAHQLAQIILEDPYSRRAFEKPRGYAGDAVMLDYIYRKHHLDTSPLGRAIHAATTTLPNAKSVLWRRDYLASMICSLMRTRPVVRILAVASGHMRELDTVKKFSQLRNVEIVALDQDRKALEEAHGCYPEFAITSINMSAFSPFKKALPLSEKFDFVYSAGLSDYLSDKAFEYLMRKLLGYVKPDGFLSVGNFTTDNHGRAFMEGFMDWSLVCRDEADLLRVAKRACSFPAEFKVFRDEMRSVAYIEVRPQEMPIHRLSSTPETPMEIAIHSASYMQ